ncbi:S-layer family protein [Paenibacillus sp. BK033]|uniref:S-layer homology domain-containing protein n=1 Tax=Paenibacillus sp. BK033 TaxID=2512133 RepID=UPI00105219FD|nr:S-layer homology domain-containing protein [Paenibacillus sp. BK033]TCM90778.1 S-layer family protein [Paenibacillus sp. BK033]
MRKSMKGKLLATVLALSLLPVGSLAYAADSGTMTVVASTGTGASTAPGGILDESLAKISKDEAVERFRKLFPELKDAEVTSIDLGNPNQYPPSNEMVWTIQWNVTVENGSYGFDSRIDAITGDIINYYNSLPREEAYYPAKVSRSEAEKIAKAFILVASPSMKSTDKLQLKPVESDYPQALFGPVQYSFSYQAQVNGIPTTSNQIQVVVDGNGNIINYYGFSTGKDYPSPDTNLTAEQAADKMKKELKLQLAYVPGADYYVNQTNTSAYRLGYVAVGGIGLIDAKSGKFLDDQGQAIDSFPATGYSSISSSAAAFKPHTGGELTKEEAIAVVTSVVGKDAFEGTQQASSSTDRDGRKTWSIYNGSPFGGIQTHATVDAKTGQLIDYSTFSYPTGDSSAADETAGKPSITEAQAKVKAQDLMTSLYPNASGSLKLVERSGTGSYSPDTAFIYSFQQFYKDKPIQPAAVQINLDGQGNLTNYYNMTLPEDKLGKLDSLTAKITEEQALKLYRDSIHAELQYTTVGGSYVDGKLQEQQVKLVYMPKLTNDNNWGFLVNAVTGKLEQQYIFPGTTVQKGEIPADAKKHWASKSLQVMFDYGIIKPEADGLIHPDQTVNNGDWVNMLLDGFTGGQSYTTPQKQRFADIPVDSPYASAVEYLVQRGFLKASPTQKLNPEQALTRGDLAVWLTKLLKYDKLSEFMSGDADVTKLKDAALIKNKGAVTVAMKLGLLTAENGKFNPNAPVTKAQISIVLLRLATLQDKVDSPIMNSNYY